jgi:hypothetical protein
MKKKSADEFNLLLKNTVEYMNINQLKDLSLKEPSSQRESCWGIITQKILKRFDRIKSLNIYKMWKTNSKNYRNTVKSMLSQLNVNNVTKSNI